MSGIAAELASRGGFDSSSTVSRMLVRMRARGPDGARAVLVDAGFARGAIGYASTVITPEEVGSIQPLTLSTGTAIAFHGRLDNRAELCADLGLVSSASLPDADIVAAGYDRWGAGIVEKLLGDFAFVIFSPRENEVFAARDHMGFCPLFYWQSDGRIRLASEKQALFADGAFSPKVNRPQLALALVDEYIERDETLLEDVRSIPPGCSLSWRGARASIDVYWRPDPWKRVAVSKPEDAVALLRETLTSAVRSRMRAVGPVAVGVSGGLDSSAVAAFAADIAARDGSAPPVLVTGRYDRGACDETPFSQRVADHLGLPLGIFDAPLVPGSYPPTFDLERLWDPYAQNIMKGLHALFRERGGRVLLSGFGSDELQILTLYETDQALHDRDLPSAFRWSGVYGDPLDPAAWRRLLGAVKRLVIPLRKVAPPSVSDWLPPYATEEAVSMIHEEWARRAIDLARYRGAGPARERALGWLTHSLNSPSGIVHAEQHAAGMGFSIRSPFFDVRVVELLLGLPMPLLFDAEISKPLLRKVVEPLLPSSIAYRSFRCFFLSFFHDLVKREAGTYAHFFRESRLERAGLVRPDELARLLDAAERDPDQALQVTMGVTYEGWLRGLETHQPEPMFTRFASVNPERGTSILW